MGDTEVGPDSGEDGAVEPDPTESVAGDESETPAEDEEPEASAEG